MRKIAIFLLLLGIVSAPIAFAQAPKTSTAKTDPKAPALKGKTVNINKATEAELVKNVPLITPDMAKKIVKYRKDNGDFGTYEELLQIDGFGRDLLRKIKPFLLLDGVGGKECTC
jgi:competence protein ComEA